MRGVIGLLFLAIGLEIAYLVLAGKLPLSKKTGTGTGTGNGPGGTGGGPDLRKFTSMPTIGLNKSGTGVPLFHWGGLA